MKILIFAINTKAGYSGGRYHALIMAEALASAGHDVGYITNVLPNFYNEFSSFPDHKKLKFYLTRNFITNLPDDKPDVVILVPHLGRRLSYFLKIRKYSLINRSRLILLNFETPNWFNTLSPIKRNPKLWDDWVRCSRQTDLILSITAESNKFAQKFFTDCSKNTQFDYCYPCINNLVADLVCEIQKEKRIIAIIRFNDIHKGGYLLPQIICDAMRGYTLVLIVGKSSIPADIIKILQDRSKEHNVKIEIKHKISEIEKFKEIKRASLMLFPTFFEGFGIPPIEALYCNVPCITFDLPVLKEVSGNMLHFVEIGNMVAFRDKIEEVLNSDLSDKFRDGIMEIALFNNFVKRLNDKICKIMNHEPAVSENERPLILIKLYTEFFCFFPYRMFFEFIRRLRTFLKSKN